MKIAVIDTVYQGYVDHLYWDGSLIEKAGRSNIGQLWKEASRR